jgi:hypothetical protein
MATLAEQKAALLVQLASVEELQDGTSRIRQANKTSIIAAIQEIERQINLESSTARPMVTLARVQRS